MSRLFVIYAYIFTLKVLYYTVSELHEDLKTETETETETEIEIEFWRELIDQFDLSLSSPEYLRMQWALQLVRWKLVDYEQIIMQAMTNSIMH